jgi:hypothetical protein
MFQPYPTNVCLLITYGVYIRMLVRSAETSNNLTGVIAVHSQITGMLLVVIFVTIFQ